MEPLGPQHSGVPNSPTPQTPVDRLTASLPASAIRTRPFFLSYTRPRGTFSPSTTVWMVAAWVPGLFFATAAPPGSRAVTPNVAAASNANWARRCGFFTSYLHHWTYPSEHFSLGEL